MENEVFAMEYESASVRLCVRYDGQLVISHLYSTIPRQGHAKALMELVCAYADKNVMCSILQAAQYGHGRGMDNAQLVTFYKSFGFYLLESSTQEKLIMRRLSQVLHGL